MVAVLTVLRKTSNYRLLPGMVGLGLGMQGDFIQLMAAQTALAITADCNSRSQGVVLELQEMLAPLMTNSNSTQVLFYCQGNGSSRPSFV